MSKRLLKYLEADKKVNAIYAETAKFIEEFGLRRPYECTYMIVSDSEKRVCEGRANLRRVLKDLGSSAYEVLFLANGRLNKNGDPELSYVVYTQELNSFKFITED